MIAKEMNLLVNAEDDARSEKSQRYSDHGSELDGYPLQPEEEFYRQQQQHLYRQDMINRPSTNIQSSFEYNPPPTFKLNKQHTGQKNVSHFTLGDDRKVDYDEASERYGSITKTVRPIDFHGKSLAVNEDETSSISSKLEHTHTDQGFLDLKFYHNRLW